MSEQERCPDCGRVRGIEGHSIELPGHDPGIFCWAHIRNAEPYGLQHECELVTITRLRSELEAHLDKANWSHCSNCGSGIKVDPDNKCASCTRRVFSVDDLPELLAERDSLREQLRLWEATREDGVALAGAVLSRGELEHQWPRARRYSASLPAPEVAEPPAQAQVEPVSPCDAGGTCGCAAKVEPEQPKAWAPKVGDIVCVDLFMKSAGGKTGVVTKPSLSRVYSRGGVGSGLVPAHMVKVDGHEYMIGEDELSPAPADPPKLEAPAPDVERALKFLRQAREDADNADKLELAYRVLDDAIRLALRALDPAASPGGQLVAPLRVRS